MMIAEELKMNSLELTTTNFKSKLISFNLEIKAKSSTKTNKIAHKEKKTSMKIITKSLGNSQQ